MIPFLPVLKGNAESTGKLARTAHGHSIYRVATLQEGRVRLPWMQYDEILPECLQITSLPLCGQDLRAPGQGRSAEAYLAPALLQIFSVMRLCATGTKILGV